MDIEEVKNLMEKQASNHDRILTIMQAQDARIKDLNIRVKNLEEFVWKGLHGKADKPIKK